MFTGIITDRGEVQAMDQRGDLRVRLSTTWDTASLAIGASVACDGVCLTVVALGPGWMEFDLSAETLARTAIGHGNSGWKKGRQVNLERALRVGDELGGHIVSGHIDGVARVVSVTPEGDSLRLTIEAPADLAPYIAEKGSVALNGTSLTVNEVQGTRFGINLIPHTRAVTTWGGVRPGDEINLEVDLLARYVARLGNTQRAG